MKKIVLLSLVSVFVFSLLYPARNSFACSISSDAKIPTTSEVLKDGADLFVVKILNSGEVVSAQVIATQRGKAPAYIVLATSGTSCDTRSNFSEGNYAVIVTPRDDDSIIYHSMLDNQFSSFYPTKEEALDAMGVLDEESKKLSSSDNETKVMYEPAGYTLRQGMRGEAIKSLQKALNVLLPSPITVDGVYGSGTAHAVQSVQDTLSLVADGIAGPKTQAQLQIELSR